MIARLISSQPENNNHLNNEDNDNDNDNDTTVVGITSCSSVLLKEMAETWAEHRLCMIMIRDILMYMDRTYVTSQRKRPVYELGLHLFRVKVWEHDKVQNRITNLLLSAISSERAGLLT